MDALEDLSYDITTSPVKQDEEQWAHTGDDDDEDDDGLGLSAAESEPREDDFDPDDVDASGSASDGSDSDEDDPTAADGDAGDDADGDQDDSLSAHSGATASMSRRESKAGESGKEDDDDDDADDDDGDDDDEDDGDEEMKEVDEQMGGLVRSASPSHAVAATQARRSPSLPPSLKRRRLFYPAPPSSPPLAARSLHIDPHMSIPIHSPVHSLAATPCLSYVLTGSEDGYVRAWDTWSSANGGSLMTAHQRAVGGLGEGVTKGGVCRGWWENEGPLPPSAGSTSATGLNGVDNDNSERQRAREPVYSLALQRDALWGLSGTASGSINLFTVRHAIGRIQHRLEDGHVGAVAGLVLADSEDLAYSAGWDGVVCEWDLHTGKKLRAFPSQNVQLSSLALQPLSSGPSAPATPNHSVSYSTWARNPKKVQPPSTNGRSGSTSAAAGADMVVPGVDLSNGDAEMASPSKTIGAPATDGGPSVAPSEIDAEGEPDLDDLFGDGELDGLAAGLDIPANLLDAVRVDPSEASATVPAATSAAPPAVAPLALPNGTAQTNGVVPKLEPNGIEPLPAASVSAEAASSSASVARSVPSLSPATYGAYSPDVLMTSAIDGSVVLWDRRVSNKEAGNGRGVGRLEGPERTPKWCMSACFNSTGTQVWAGRRNGAVDIWDVRRPSSVSSAAAFDSGSNLLKSLKNPSDSGAVSCLVAFPDGKHMACAQADNVRLWATDALFDEADSVSTTTKSKSSGVPFKIIPGHHGGIISSMVVDPRSKFLITASGNRGWAGFGESTSVVLYHTVEKTLARR